jgi:membrane associated rhomboid family serine protease
MSSKKRWLLPLILLIWIAVTAWVFWDILMLIISGKKTTVALKDDNTNTH